MEWYNFAQDIENNSYNSWALNQNPAWSEINYPKNIMESERQFHWTLQSVYYKNNHLYGMIFKTK